MAFIQWDESYSVNVAEIDQEHKKLLDLTNQLHDAMRNGQGKLVVGNIINELLKYTETHFRNEEILMEKAGYPGLASHKLVHKRLVDQVKDLAEKANNGNLSLSLEVMNFLKDWLVEHIKGTDKNYSSHLNKHGIL